MHDGLLILFGHFIPGLHHVVSIRVLRLSVSVQTGRAGIDQMDEAARFLRDAFHFVAGRLLHRLRAPVGTHIRENLRPVGQKLHEQHAQAVEHIVFRRQHVRLARAVPVKGGVQHGLREIRVGIKIRPLALSLEAGRDGVVSHHFFLATLRKLFVSVHQILDDAHHLHDELPVLILLLSVFLHRLRVLVKALDAVCLRPGQRLFKLRLIVDALRHAADDFHLVHGLHAHAEIFFHKSGIDDGAADSHTDGTDLQVGFSPHGGNRNRRPAEAKQLLRHVLRNLRRVRILHIISVNAESGKALLRMGGKNARQIHRAGTLRSVKAPHALDGFGIHVHGLRPVAPAGRHRQRDIHARLPELVRAGRRLSHTSDGGVRNDHLHRLAVGIPQVLGKQLRRGLRHVHGLLLQRLPHLQISPSAVDRRPDADHRIIPYIPVFCHFFTSYYSAAAGGISFLKERRQPFFAPCRSVC